MASENMVWAVNGPVPHDPEMAREQTWINTGGQTGVVGPESLQVRAFDTPGAGVRVMPGGFAIQATPGGSAGYTNAPWQSYGRAVYQSGTVDIRATGSSGSRSDVVGIIINDPQYEGTADGMSESDWENHRFWDYHVIENAPTNLNTARGFGLSRPFLPLARITIPANTATITNDMISDLRFMAVRRTHTDLFSYTPSRRRDMWSGGTYTETVDREIPIPQWATRLVVQGGINGMALAGDTPNVTGTASALIMVGDASNPNNVFELERTQIYQVDQARWTRIVVPISGTWAVPSARRGQNMRIFFRFNLNASSAGMLMIQETGTRFDLTLHWEEAPVGINS